MFSSRVDGQTGSFGKASDGGYKSEGFVGCRRGGFVVQRRLTQIDAREAGKQDRAFEVDVQRVVDIGFLFTSKTHRFCISRLFFFWCLATNKRRKKQGVLNTFLTLSNVKVASTMFSSLLMPATLAAWSTRPQVLYASSKSPRLARWSWTLVYKNFTTCPGLQVAESSAARASP